MDDWTKLFDLLLLNVAAYPVTIWNLIFHPLRVFQEVANERKCAPGLTYLFTVSLSYVWWQAAYFLENIKPPDWLTRDNVVGLALAYVAIIVNVQQYAVSKFIGVAHISLRDQLEALVYAFCPVLVLTMVVTAAGWLEQTSKALIPAALGLQALYLWCLYNVGHAVFHLSTGSAVGSAFVAWGCFFGIVLLVLSALWLMPFGKRTAPEKV